MSRRKAILLLLGLVGAALLAVGYYLWLLPWCPPTSGPEPWLKSPTDPHGEGWTEVPRSDFRPVPFDSVPRAAELLKEAPVIELDDEELKSFLPGPYPRCEGCKAYLVRGLMVRGTEGKPLGTGAFVVKFRNKELRVQFGALGRWDCGHGRAPLVIWLTFKPTVVYTDTAMAV
jgi:hypothetical protein